MKKTIAFIVALVLVMMMGMGCSKPVDKVNGPEETAEGSYEKPKFLNLAAGPTSGLYYPAGIAIAEIFINELGISTTAQITGGAAENPGLVHELADELGITMTSTAYDAYYGNGAFTEPYDDVLGWFNNLTIGALQMIVLEDSDIHSYEDMKGKRIAMGSAGNGGIGIAADIWEYYGFSEADCKTTYVSFGDCLTALKDGTVDVALVQAGPPTAAIKEFAATTSNFRIISVEQEVIDALTAKSPYYTALQIPADTYGISEDAVVMGIPVMGIVSATLSDELVYDLTKALCENIQIVADCNAGAKEFSLDNVAKDIPIPLHPGAQRYFEEQGLL